MKDNAAVQQGTALFRDLHARVATAATAYNLANGNHASATLSGEPYRSPTRCRMRQEARSLDSEAAADEGHRSRALTNLANLRRLSHRRLEAYDAYASAPEADPQNAIASSGIARLLSEIADFRLGPQTYAREMVLWRERRSSAEGKLRAPMYAPPHHEIRGLKPRMRKR